MSILYIVLGLIAAGVGTWRMWIFATARVSQQSTTDLVIAIIAILVAITFIGLFIAGRVNKEEEIHITK